MLLTIGIGNFWSAVTCHRFGPGRLDALLLQKFDAAWPLQSRPTKAVTGHRTPKIIRFFSRRAAVALNSSRFYSSRHAEAVMRLFILQGGVGALLNRTRAASS